MSSISFPVAWLSSNRAESACGRRREKLGFDDVLAYVAMTKPAVSLGADVEWRIADVIESHDAPIHIHHLAIPTPNRKSCYKQLFVKGTRIRARVLYGMFVSAEQPMTPEEIASEFNLPPEAVKQAIAYCQSNPPEIVEDYARDERFMQASGMDQPDYKYDGKFKVVPPEEVARILKSRGCISALTPRRRC